MMRRIGRPVLWAVILLLGQVGVLAHAAVEATVDRQQVSMGDTLQLVISATEDDEDLGTVSLDSLRSDWEILSRKTRSNTTIVNGKRNHNRQLQIELTPRRTGALIISSFQVGAGKTTPVWVNVSKAPVVHSGKEAVLFEATVDADSVYVQGQLILTLRLQQAVNLDGRSISDLQLPGAFVVPLEQKSFQRTVSNRPWLVHEVRYAIFPEKSGVLEIPAQSFSARESGSRRSVFDTSRGKLVRLQSQPLSIEVLPRPAAYPGDTWLPARNIVVEEEWSTDPEKLRVGESVTRTIRLRGEGLQGAQLPPALLTATNGIKHYPDQPTIADAEISTGLLGSRSDSVAVVPTRTGNIELAAVEIPWWDTQAQVMRTAVIPARTLQVAPAIDSPVATSTNIEQQIATSGTADAGQQPLWQWQLAALVCAIGWAITLLVLLRSRSRRSQQQEDGEQPAPASPKAAYKSLVAACAADQPLQARKKLIQWAAALCDDARITSLNTAGEALADAELNAQLLQLEQALYSREGASWSGAQLRATVERLHKQPGSRKQGEAESLSLYPIG
ncbi:MAG: BatD family protein [Halioglobus sp.]